MTGDVTGASGDLGHLHLSWRFPTSGQLGNYTCTTTAITTSGHTVTLTKSVTLTQTPVYFEDVLRELRDLKMSDQAQNATVNKDIQKLKTDIETLKSNVAAYKTEINALKAEVKEARHTETGLLWCGGARSWVQEGSDKTYHGKNYYNYQRKMSASFKTPYTTAPVVFLDISHVYDETNDYTKYGSQILSVDTRGFSMRCGSRSDGMYDVEVRWIAVAA